jgi:hypothetical protein
MADQPGPMAVGRWGARRSGAVGTGIRRDRMRVGGADEHRIVVVIVARLGALIAPAVGLQLVRRPPKLDFLRHFWQGNHIAEK